MKLAIVVPVLDEADQVSSRLQALAPYRADGVHVVVVDGGSRDDTVQRATPLVDQVLVAPRGRSSQMNAGARAAAALGADTLLFLHADTRLPEGAVALIGRAMGNGAEWGRFDVHIEGRHPLLPMVATLMNLRSRLTGIATGDQAVFVRRRLFEAVGGFPEQPLMEDIALSVRLRQVSRPACLREHVTTSGRRWDRHGLWATIVLMWRLRAAYARGADPHALALRYGYRPRATAALAIMAKAPVPGLAKTRLVPLLGQTGAARAQRGFILRALACVRAAALGPVTLWCAPDAQHRLFRLLRERLGVVTRPQPEGDLGQRMRVAMQAHFDRAPHQPWIVVGTDCPALTPAHLQAMADALLRHGAAVLPAEDGGYVALGLARSCPSVFEGVDWSTPQVLAQTLERLNANGTTCVELPALWDVDEPADWLRWQALPTRS
ncbi:MAG: TIGR04283 family arsenosugar biosynthesis glycosyltransferase [Hydrogenophaga sp.]|jgi:rSAM/selenodomain-associated transferase 2/rSAM/selenodomain-associated transferase 1|nr:TIGR04283 family arsenosugar biosynthesis glycosyltransferase [Hydrogenophaga sp.]